MLVRLLAKLFINPTNIPLRRFARDDILFGDRFFVTLNGCPLCTYFPNRSMRKRISAASA